jgi:ribose transport system ATP-binding protein
MQEVERVGRRVTVLRDGKRVATHAVGAVGIAELVRLMANRELTEHFPKRRVEPGEVVLRASDITRGKALRGCGIVLRRGEVVGLAGLLGAGRTELARALVGADKVERGSVEVKGRAVLARGPGDVIERGVGLVPEDRKTQGLVLGLSVQDNLALPSARKLSKLGVVDARAEAELAERQIQDLRIKTPSRSQPVALLSGGNQQKVVLGKWLGAEVDVLILDEPTRGIDVGAKVEIYELMNRLTAQGAAILMISSELPEILGMSDRIVVMHQGRVAAELDAREASQERVLAAALGRAQ